MKSERNTHNAHLVPAMKLALYGIFALLIAAATPQSASASTRATGVTLYNGPGLCVRGDAGIDQTRPNSLNRNHAYATTYALSQGCGAGLNKPDGWAAVKLEVFKWTGSSWAFCRGTNWKHGATGTNQWGLLGPSQLLDYGGSSSCGPGFYGTMGHSYVWDGSAWRGGKLWSGHEFVL